MSSFPSISHCEARNREETSRVPAAKMETFVQGDWRQKKALKSSNFILRILYSTTHFFKSSTRTKLAVGTCYNKATVIMLLCNGRLCVAAPEVIGPPNGRKKGKKLETGKEFQSLFILLFFPLCLCVELAGLKWTCCAGACVARRPLCRRNKVRHDCFLLKET